MSDFNWHQWIPIFCIYSVIIIAWYAYCIHSYLQDCKQEKRLYNILAKIKGRKIFYYR